MWQSLARPIHFQAWHTQACTPFCDLAWGKCIFAPWPKTEPGWFSTHPCLGATHTLGLLGTPSPPHDCSVPTTTPLHRSKGSNHTPLCLLPSLPPHMSLLTFLPSGFGDLGFLSPGTSLRCFSIAIVLNWHPGAHFPSFPLLMTGCCCTAHTCTIPVFGSWANFT